MKYTPSEIKDSVDILTVCDWLGIPTSIKGRNINILCPAHNDKNFGSCYIRDNKFVCYTCNIAGDIFDLVMHSRGCDFKEACKWLCDHLGGEMKWDTTNRKKILDDESLETIFLSTIQNPIYITDAFLTESEYFDTDDKLHIKMYNDTKSDMCICVKEKMVLHNPLLDLCRNDEEAYMELIYDKSCEALKKYEIMLEFIKDKNVSRVNYAYVNPSQLYACLKILDTIGYIEYANVLTAKMNRCKELINEFSSNKPKHNNKSKKSRIFGNLKSGVSV